MSQAAVLPQRDIRLGPNGRPEFHVGDVIDDRYELMRDLGRGAAGIVFEARHKFTHRRVALKVVSPDSPRAAQGELRARLVREARALAAARHPSIVDVLDGGVTSCGTPYIVLEMLEGGRTLEGLLATRGKLSVKDAVAVGLQLCDGLSAAHKAGVVHRDVKPGNIIVLRDHGGEIIKLVDFGIAHIQSREGKLTSHGAIIGTPEYMAPEQILLTGDMDPLVDVYAVGITLFECIAGRVPFVGNYQQVLLQIGSLSEAPPLVSIAPIAGPKLSAVVARALAKERSVRYQSIDELARDLAAAIPGARRRTQFFPTATGPLPAGGGASPGPMSGPITPPSSSTMRAAVAVEQRRRAVRANYATPVQVVLADGVHVDGRSEDLSEGGLLIILDTGTEIAHDQVVRLRFALPIDGRVVACHAQVRWVRTSHGRRAMGVQFVDAPPELGPQVDRYISLMGVPKEG
jgi:eukaryotic-like serine/threonine-protein kinase